MSAIYDNFGIRFPYPENWQLNDGHDPNWPESVSLQSPSGAFWSVTIHPASSDVEELTSVVIDALREEYEDLEVESVSESVAGTPVTGYDLRFYCLDLLVEGRLRSFHKGSRTLLVLCQAEDREFDKVEPVFRAITHALLNPRLIQDSP